jgi:endonuclease/exonuclease/phosphatase family metal-dependent hydrolase
MRSIVAFGFTVLLLMPVTGAQAVSGSQVQERYHDPELLSFNDVVTLSATAQPKGALGARFYELLNTPFVRNDASAGDVSRHRPGSEDGTEDRGPVLRVGLWNIERGLNFELIRAALTDTTEFERLAEAQNHWGAGQRERIESQLATLQNVDVLVLDEVDRGMKRTEYRDVARELASALHMNYVYGVEFVEVDPIFALGTEQVHLANAQEDLRLQQDLEVDHERYRGLHGTAILSRYPIRSARILRLPVCYDWYGQEVKAAANLEKGKRWAAHKLFAERIAREIRQGGRMALIADIGVPELPGGEATIVAPHLENRCAPACRRRQMTALLAELKQERNPVVIAGDLNTTGQTNTPTSVQNEIMSRVTDYQFWIGQTISWFHPLGIYKHVLVPVHYFHGYNDPTAFHIPILWNNREQHLFRSVGKFRFADEGAFDFQGDPERTLNRKGRTLSDSNERSTKGFVPTYAFARDYGGLVGRFKLDWFFVKPLTEEPRGDGQFSWLAPQFPRTMRELNQSVEDRISDHPPLTVDLSLGEPQRAAVNGQH